MEWEPPPPAAVEEPSPAGRHPVQVVVEDDLHRPRLTVFFRLLLAIPHYIWFILWSLFAFLISIVNWFITLIRGQSAESLHDFYCSYVRYTTHLYAYFCLAANPYPGFTGKPGYPVDVELPPLERQGRWKTAFRLILAIPALILSGIFVGSPGGGGGGGTSGEQQTGWEDVAFTVGGGVVFVVAFFAWFACMVRGRMPGGFRDLVAYVLRYNAQTLAYFLLVTDRYPTADPADPPAQAPPKPPAVRVRIQEDLRRSRLTVFFRFLLFLPHLVWFVLWSIAFFFAAVVGWFASLILGRLPRPLHRFIAAYVRYAAHLSAFLFIVANPFPGFTGAAGSYPVDIEIDPPERQARWKTFFRFFLALPALFVSSALGSAIVAVGIFGWFVSLALGRMPAGLRSLGAFEIRYSSQAYAYLYLLTDRYPYSGPWEFAPPEPEPLDAELEPAPV
jgi:Domain of unknown function (DUF4389)